MKVTIDLTKNYGSLNYGDGYAVLYYDVERQKVAVRIGIWRGQEFEFPTMKLKQKPVVEPCLFQNSIPAQNYVLGWYRMKDWEEETPIDLNDHACSEYFVAPI